MRLPLRVIGKCTHPVCAGVAQAGSITWLRRNWSYAAYDESGALNSRKGGIHVFVSGDGGWYRAQTIPGLQSYRRGWVQRELKRTTTCFGFSRPSSNVSLKASTIIRMRGGVRVKLLIPCGTKEKKKREKEKRWWEIRNSRGCKEGAFRRTCSRISSDDRPWFCGARTSISRYHRLSGNGVNALLGRMGQILLIMSSGVDRENLTAWQRNAAASAS